MKNLIYILLILVSLIGCKKEEKKEKMVLTGRLIKDCSGTPLANFSLEAVVSTRRIFHSKDYYLFDTDAHGSFNLLIDEIGSIELRAAAGAILLTGIPGTQSEVHLGTFMASPTTSFVYRIKVNNPYNVGDTLVTNLQGGGGAQFKFAAPFKDTAITILNYSGKKDLVSSFQNNGIFPVEIGYGIYKTDIRVASNWYINIPKVQFNIQPCNQGNQEIVLEIN